MLDLMVRAAVNLNGVPAAEARFVWTENIVAIEDEAGMLGVALSVADAEGTITPDGAELLERWAVR